MKTKRFFALICVLLALGLVPRARANTYADLPEVDVRAASALLLDADTGEHLYEREPEALREPASLTKIMTCMLALEMTGDWETHKNDIVTVTQAAFFDMVPDGSTSGLKAGEEIRLEDLLYCVMLQSANEGCNVLAIHLSGSVEAFVARMNERAAELGCEKTVFKNTHGLPAAGHVTTALDISRITLQAVKTPQFMQIAHTDSYTVPPTNKTEARRLTTTNSLISTSRYSEYIYPPAKGIKTGHTTAAGYCLVSMAEKDNLRLISVVMGAVMEPDTQRQRHFVETKLLFEWGFENWVPRRLLTRTDIVGELNVLLGAGKDAVTLVPENEITALVPKSLDLAKIERKISLDNPEGRYAPIYKDEVLGTVTLQTEGHVYGVVRLLASFTVEEDTATKFMLDVRDWFSQPWIKWTLIGLGSLLVLYITLTVALNYRRRRERTRRPGNYRGRKRRR
ncbi:MAG: D-alanyl-D-alanine carboxypeptidase [Oscillospiraceae bacterium]|jgi:D-alanyl-D-alanine carboxypeptidase (penicillin-binding protein 5/6)|nr:D-alanyl-D-alanine carboxypeptidase [Oscillospiraceae bacterium]